MMKLAPGLHSHSTAAAISSGSPSRLMGWLASACCEVELAGGEHVGDHRGGDGAGADGVDPDPAGCVFEGGAAGQAEDAVLGGVVGGPAGEVVARIHR